MDRSTRRFDGTTAVVTGAGSGIGLEVARRITGEGGRVVAVDIAADRVGTAASELGVIGVAGDITDQGTIERVLDATAGRVDVLANVAGIMDGFIPVHELDDTTWDQVLAVNLTAPFRLTRAVLPAMMAAGKGAIVNVASEAALRAGTSGAAYTASKHALVGLTRSTAVFYATHGIRCNALCPGAVQTGIDAASRSEYGRAVVERHLGGMFSWATPDAVAAAVCWLASDDSANVNGAVLTSDGGWSAA